MTTDLRRSFATATGLLSVAMLAASAANYALNVGLARLLDPAEFGDATLVVTLLLGLTAVGVALQMITARLVVGVRADAQAAAEIRNQLARRAAAAGWALMAVTMGAAPLLQDLFRTGSALPFVALAAGLPVYLVQSVDRGVLQGRLAFRPLAVSFVAEAVVRLFGGLALVAAGFGVTGATVALSLSFVGSWAVMRRGRPTTATNEPARQPTTRPTDPLDRPALAAASRATIVLLVGQIIVNNGDVIWAKQLLDPDTAGAYAAVALVGRAVFFCSWAVANAAFPLVDADSAPAGADGGRHSVLVMGVSVVGAMSAAAIAVIAVLGDRIGPLLFGTDLAEVQGLFVPYAAATGLFAVANLIATVDVARGRVDTALAVLAGGILQTVLLVGLGSSPATLVDAQVIAMVVLVLGTVGLHRRAGATRPAPSAPAPVAAPVHARRTPAPVT